MTNGIFDSNVVGTPAVSATGTNGADGVDATSDSSFGVFASSSSGIGVFGTTPGAGSGVAGSSDSGFGVDGVSNSGTGVQGISTDGTGIFALSANGIGIHAVGGGANPTTPPIPQAAIFAEGGAELGVGGTGILATGGDFGVRGEGQRSGATGVSGHSPDGFGVVGFSENNIGINASSSTGTGLVASSGTGIGVLAQSPNSTAMRALSGDSNSYTSIAIGRIADEGRIGVAAAAGQFANDAVAGDIILRTETPSQHLLFGNGTGDSTMAIFNGDVGIGTPNPGSNLHIHVPASGNTINAFTLDVESFVTPANANASFFVQVRDIEAAPPQGFTHFCIRGNGDVGIGKNNPQVKLDVVGDIHATGTKNFVQAHPTDPTKEIVYATLEGGEAGTYTRGIWKLDNGKAVIKLPEHFGLVTSEDGLTVQFTPRGEWLQLYVVQVNTRELVVRETQGKSGQFDYLIQGVRKGYEHHEVIQERK